jgi:ABC-type sugar transport system substrate-binding protein
MTAIAALLMALGAVLMLFAQSLLSDRAGADAETGSTTVRISAMKSDAGDVRFALQPHDGEGWAERLHPRLNTLRADAPANRWLNSSPIQLAGLVSVGDHVDEEVAEDVAEAPSSIENTEHGATEPGTAEPVADERPLFCVVAHGHADDPFWQQLRGYMYQSSLHLDVHVRFHSSPDGESQAAAIAQCSAEGAAAIAATLANPDAVTEPLQAAKQAGARIVTFNSGASHAKAAGSSLHVALDDLAAGRFIAERLIEGEITGTVACLIHERQNVGLEERCDGLAQAYTGQVRRITLPTAEDADALQAALRELLLADGDDANDVIVTLNAGTSVEVLKMVIAIEDELGPVLDDKRLVPMGYSPERRRYREQREEAGREMLDLTGVADAAEAQGYFVVSALMHIARFPLIPIIGEPTIMLITPWNLSIANVFMLDPAEVFAISRENQGIIADGARVEPIGAE